MMAENCCCDNIAIGRNGTIIPELNAFLLHYADAAVDDFLVQLEVGDAITQESAGGFVLLEDSHLVAHIVEGIRSSKTCRTTTDDSHTMSVALGVLNGHISFQEGSLGNGTFILAIGDSLARRMIEHASLLAKSRTDAARELGEGIGLLQ